MLWHPSTLKMILDFKQNKEDCPSDALVAALLDALNAKHDVKEMEAVLKHILYSHTGKKENGLIEKINEILEKKKTKSNFKINLSSNIPKQYNDHSDLIYKTDTDEIFMDSSDIIEDESYLLNINSDPFKRPMEKDHKVYEEHVSVLPLCTKASALNSSILESSPPPAIGPVNTDSEELKNIIENNMEKIIEDREILKVLVDGFKRKEASIEQKGLSNKAKRQKLDKANKEENKVNNDIETKVENENKKDNDSEMMKVDEASPEAPVKKKRGRKKIVPETPKNLNVLNFATLAKKPVEKIEKFEPLILRHATFLYDKNNISLESIRKRDNLTEPVKMQFIKHYDQRRPPVYRKRGRIMARKKSYDRMEEILNYDEDSSEEWEEQGEIECEESSLESTESEEGSEKAVWIERDDSSAEEEVMRSSKKPTFNFDPIVIEVYFNLNNQD
ncbi:hypothetical protein ENBRE01_1869 [Enteropsectra breve]|nr:hypothetical protein ENBRE01_1869 [Enteropsectra breve]